MVCNTIENDNQSCEKVDIYIFVKWFSCPDIRQ